MSQRAFIIILDLDDGVDPASVAEELTADLSDFDIISIHPWASSGQSSGQSPLSPVVAPPLQ